MNLNSAEIEYLDSVINEFSDEKFEHSYDFGRFLKLLRRLMDEDFSTIHQVIKRMLQNNLNSLPESVTRMSGTFLFFENRCGNFSRRFFFIFKHMSRVDQFFFQNKSKTKKLIIIDQSQSSTEISIPSEICWCCTVTLRRLCLSSARRVLYHFRRHRPIQTTRRVINGAVLAATHFTNGPAQTFFAQRWNLIINDFEFSFQKQNSSTARLDDPP